MRFARIFTVAADAQLLCVLQASVEDGLPEIEVTTYVAGLRVSFANRLAAVGDAAADPHALLERTRALLDGLEQADAEEAWRVAVDIARRLRAGELEAQHGSFTIARDGGLHGVEDAAALGVESYPSDDLRRWLDPGEPGGALH